MSGDPFDGIYAPRQESLIQRYGKRIAGGIACSAFVAFVMHLPVIKTLILWACQIVLLVFGRPAGMEKLEDKFAHVVEKGRQVAHAHPGAATLLAPVREVMAVKKAAEEFKEKADDVKDTAKQGVQAIRNTGEKVADALGSVGERAKDAVGGVGTSISEMVHARAKAQEEARKAQEEAYRDRLIVRAKAINFPIDESWSITRLDAEMQQAERQWQAAHGPNAQCTNPRCRYGMRIKSNRAENRRCPRCGQIFSSRTALQLGAPPQPSRPRGVFGR